MTMTIKEIVDKYLPDAIEKLYPEFTPFFESYMKWMDEQGVYGVLDRFDVDNIDDKFIENFTNVYLNGIPTANPLKTMSDEEIRHFIKEITDVNKSKGLDASIKYFFNRIFGREIGIEHGLLGVLLKYKPVEIEIEAVDVDGNPIQNPYWHSYSNENFVVVSNQKLNGLSVTYFNDGKNKLWIESLNGTLQIGDVLYFPDTGVYAKVLHVDMLDLDGWLNQKERWVDADGMYITGRYNNRLYNTFPIEVNGFSEFTVYPYNASNSTYSSEFLDTGKLTFTINDNTYNGAITETYSIEKNGVVYQAEFTANINAGQIESISINGNNETLLSPSPTLSRQFKATEFYDANGNQAMTDDELALTVERVAIHTIYLKTDVPREIYFQLIRDIVFPAGFSIFTLFSLFSGILDASEDYSNDKLYKLKYWHGVFDAIDLTKVMEIVKTSILLGSRYVSMSMYDWDRWYKYDLWTEKFFGDISKIDELLVGIIDTPDYTDVPLFTIVYPRITEVALKYFHKVNSNTYSYYKLFSSKYVTDVSPRLYSICNWLRYGDERPFDRSYFSVDLLDNYPVGFENTEACNTTDVLYDTHYAPKTRIDIEDYNGTVNADYTYTDLQVIINQ